jgi:hypothetical protein
MQGAPAFGHPWVQVVNNNEAQDRWIAMETLRRLVPSTQAMAVRTALFLMLFVMISDDEYILTVRHTVFCAAALC